MKKNASDEQFLDKLTELFLKNGISKLTISDIASQLRCSRRRLYEIGSTKEDIFGNIVKRFFNIVLIESAELIANETNLKNAIVTYLEIGVRTGGRMSADFLDDLEKYDVTRKSFTDYQKIRTLSLAKMIDEGVSKSIFIKCHGLVVTEMMFGAAMRLRKPTFLKDAGLTIEEAFHEFYKVLLNGLLLNNTPDTDI